ncbi:hypothetical protein KKB14_02630, partial [Patescibacteria group bacterium]|nr:hypothetical protein [Patescibacteria group bacterium]
KESGDKMKPEDKKELEEKLEALKKVKDTDQYDEIKKKMEEMNVVAQRIGTAMYQSASAEAKTSAEPTADNPIGEQPNGDTGAGDKKKEEGDKKEDKKKDGEVVEGEVESN